MATLGAATPEPEAESVPAAPPRRDDDVPGLSVPVVVDLSPWLIPAPAPPIESLPPVATVVAAIDQASRSAAPNVIHDAVAPPVRGTAAPVPAAPEPELMETEALLEPVADGSAPDRLPFRQAPPVREAAPAAPPAAPAPDKAPAPDTGRLETKAAVVAPLPANERTNAASKPETRANVAAQPMESSASHASAADGPEPSLSLPDRGLAVRRGAPAASRQPVHAPSGPRPTSQLPASGAREELPPSPAATDSPHIPTAASSARVGAGRHDPAYRLDVMAPALAEPARLDSAVATPLARSGEPRTPASEPTLADQIVQSLRLHATSGGGEARVQLRPEYLGEVTVRVVVEHGTVSARLEADVPAVREWVERNELSLRQALGEHGLTLESLSVGEHDRGGDGPDPEGRRQDSGAETPPRHRRQRRRDGEPRFEVTL
jgi:hypothetical protein